MRRQGVVWLAVGWLAGVVMTLGAVMLTGGLYEYPVYSGARPGVVGISNDEFDRIANSRVCEPHTGSPGLSYFKCPRLHWP